MRILRISKAGRNVKIEFDEREKILVRYEVFMTLGLRKNDDVEAKKIEEILFENEKFLAKEAAFRILGGRLHSYVELRRKLLQRKFSVEVISLTLNDMREKKYLDDKNFAEEYCKEKFRAKNIGGNKLRSELLNKGVDREIIDEVISKYSDQDFLTTAIKAAKKKAASLARKSPSKEELKNKVYSHLASRGYSFDVIKEACKFIEEEFE